MNPVEWRTSPAPVEYPEAMAVMETRVADILAGNAPEMVWLLEHPPLYTAGTSARQSDLLDSMRFPVYPTGRGGQFTYHGPGQRIAYAMLDLRRRARPGQPDLRRYVQQLEQWIIASLAQLGVTSFIREGRIGVWVQDAHASESKIAALGIRVRKWVSYHGIAINVHPDLSHYSGIVPCGIQQFGVTSLKEQGLTAGMTDIDAALAHNFAQLF
jgi:lipoyl(octanoyl) transferase